jgi:hypothetical protein
MTPPLNDGFLGVFLAKAWYSLIAPPKSSLISKNAEESLRNSRHGLPVFITINGNAHHRVFGDFTNSPLRTQTIAQIGDFRNGQTLVINHQSQLYFAQEFLKLCYNLFLIG